MKELKKLSWLLLASVATAFFAACSNTEDLTDTGDNDGKIVAPAGKGTEAEPYNVLAAIQMNDANKESTTAPVAFVKGYIIGHFKNYKTSDSGVMQLDKPFTADDGEGNSYSTGNNILIADNQGETDKKKMVVVKIYDDYRNALNLVSNQDNLNKQVVLKGMLKAAYGMSGMSELTYALIDGKQVGSTETPNTQGEGTKEKPYNVADVKTLNNNGKYGWIKAFIVGQVNGKSLDDAQFEAPFTGSANDDGTTKNYGTNLLLADDAATNTADACLTVQLPTGAVRDALELVGNPGNDSKEILIYGSFEKYFSTNGLKNCSAVYLDGTLHGTDPDELSDAILSETFKNGFGQFTTQSVLGDYTWKADTKYGYVSMSGYDSATKTSVANEDWLVSPEIDLSKATILKFEQALGPASAKIDNASSIYTVYTSTDYAGDVTTATWTQVQISYPEKAGWTFSTTSVELPAAGQKVHFAFKYKNADGDDTATWEIKNLTVTEKK